MHKFFILAFGLVVAAALNGCCCLPCGGGCGGGACGGGGCSTGACGVQGAYYAPAPCNGSCGI